MDEILDEILIDLLQLFKGLCLLGAAGMAHLWSDVLPIISATTAILAFTVAVHSFARLAYRWFRGINTISSKDDLS